MTAAAIRRGAASKRKPVKALRRSPRASFGARLLAALPVSARTLERGITFAIVGIALVGVVAIALMLDVPRRAGLAAGEAVGRAGFAVRHIDVTGIDRMDRMSVYAVALDQRSIAMPLVDLAGVRARLLQYGWVADAQVSRRLPDTLAINIVERKPAAVWQHAQKLTLVDAQGIALEPVRLDAMPDLPRVIGPDANAQASALTDLMRFAPRLKPVVDSAVWVGERRWNLRFQSGETLMLPEGERAAARALVKFAELDAAQRLLGQGVVRFDMRLPDRMAILPRVREKPATPQPPANKQLNPALST